MSADHNIVITEAMKKMRRIENTSLMPWKREHDKEVPTIAWLLCHPQMNVRELILSCGSISARNMTKLGESLCNTDCKLQEAWFTQMRLDSKAIAGFACGLRRSRLRCLSLANTRIEPMGIERIADALASRHCQLASVNLAKTGVGCKGARLIATAIRTGYGRLTRLDLTGCGVGDDGMRAIAKALRSSRCNLKVLDLALNRFSTAMPILSALRHPNCKLEFVGLACCDLKDRDADMLVDSLRNPRCCLTRLDLEACGMSDYGAGRLACLLESTGNKLTLLNWCGQTATANKRMIQALGNTNCKIARMYTTPTGISGIALIRTLFANGNKNAKQFANAMLHSVFGQCAPKRALWIVAQFALERTTLYLTWELRQHLETIRQTLFESPLSRTNC